MASRQHELQLPHPIFTPSNPPILFNTSTAGGSGDMKVRYCVYHIHLLWCFDSPENFRTWRRFVATSTIPPTPITNPNQLLGAQIYIPDKGMWQYEGKKCTATSSFALLLQTHLFFCIILQVSTAPITMPPTLTLRPTRWLGSPIYYLNGWRMKYGGEKSIATLSFLVLCKLTSFVFPLNIHSH